jgi:hypothetical protein
MTGLTKEQITGALERLDREIGARGARAELYDVCGAVMCLVFDARPSTKDVDAWFTEPTVVRDAARRVASRRSWVSRKIGSTMLRRGSFLRARPSSVGGRCLISTSPSPTSGRSSR